MEINPYDLSGWDNVSSPDFESSETYIEEETIEFLKWLPDDCKITYGDTCIISTMDDEMFELKFEEFKREKR
jgi:hypothetical protein